MKTDGQSAVQLLLFIGGISLVPALLLTAEWRDDRRGKISLNRETVLCVLLTMSQMGTGAMLAMATLPEW